MDFGMPTLVELNGLEQNAALCRQLGLQFVELNMNLPEYADLARICRKELCAWKKEGVYFTLHLDERMDVCDFNPKVASAYLHTMREALELAGETEIPVLNLHLNPGVYFTLPKEKVYLYAKREAQYLSSLETLRSLVEKYAPAGTTVCMENTDGFTPFMRKGIELLLESPRFALTLDTGHMHCIHDRDQDVYEKHRDRLKHMHLHDAMLVPGKNHLPLGDGELDIRQKLRLAMDCGCRAVIEVKTAQALQASAEKLPQYLDQ